MGGEKIWRKKVLEKEEGGGAPPKKQLLRSNLFSSSVTHLKASVTAWQAVGSPRAFPSHFMSPSRQTATLSRPRYQPLVVIQIKDEYHGCQIALKTPWKIDLRHFPFSRRCLVAS